MDHKFQVHLTGLIDLLSNHLYSGPEVFVRELLQNGVDAIRAREMMEPGIVGQVTIEVSGKRGARTLLFADNGIGLTESEVHQFLATIGESSKRAAKDGELPVDFIGQFGIGLLSCFMVSNEITVVTRSARGGPAIEWRGRPDGTYSLKTLDADLAPGTQAYLTCKEGSEEYYETARVKELAAHYGGLLPYEIRISRGKSTELVNADPPPWRKSFASERERTKAYLDYGFAVFQTNFLDAVPLRSEAGEVEGIAFVTPHSIATTAGRSDRVYLKNMLLSEEIDNLLPEWAFFAKAVVNAVKLRPTASRESFYEDAALERARDALGEQLRKYLMDLVERRPEMFERFLSVHQLALRALALDDDECYRLFVPWLPFETAEGKMTLVDYLAKHSVIRYVPGIDEFRQVARVAAAQGIGLVNGGYIYDADLLAKYSDIFPDVASEAVDPASIVQTFRDLDADESDSAHAFLMTADSVLRPLKCTAEIRKFDPAELPALYSINSEGRFLRSVEQTKEVADALWAGVLDGLAKRESASAPPAHLCFNYQNRLVRRLIAVKNGEPMRRAIQMLYVQSLLLGHHALSAREMALLNEGLLGLIDASLPGS